MARRPPARSRTPRSLIRRGFTCPALWRFSGRPTRSITCAGRTRLIGIISRGDVLDGFTRRDADIHREVVRDLIARRFLLDPEAFTVMVRDGIVTLSGRPESG